MSDIYVLKKSTRKGKKYMLITPDDKKVHFGQANAKDFTQHKDPKRMSLYKQRHKKRESKYWTHTKSNLVRPSYLSRYISWEKPNIDDAIKYIQEKQNIIINNEL